MKEISGERLYKNIQYYWVYRKGYQLEDLKNRLGPRYEEYKLLPKFETVPNRMVAEYARILKTSTSRLRMKNKKRNGVIEKINKTRAKKYNLSESDNLDEKAVSFASPLSNPNSNTKPKPDITSKKWNDNDAKKWREFLEKRKNGDIDDSEFDRDAIK